MMQRRGAMPALLLLTALTAAAAKPHPPPIQPFSLADVQVVGRTAAAPKKHALH